MALDLVCVLTGLFLDGALLDIHQIKHSIKEFHQATHMAYLSLKDNKVNFNSVLWWTK